MRSARTRPEVMTRGFQFDVALSFAEENRDFVERVAEQLKKKGIRFFYDEYERIDTWGKDLYTHLDEIYREKARFCVVFTSEHYKQKRWSTHERIRAQARAFFMKNQEYILPFRFDDTVIDELPPTVAYLSIQTYDETRLAEAIQDKLQKDRKKRMPLWLKFRRIFGHRISAVAGLGLSILAAVTWLPERLMPVATLAEQIHERSKMPRYTLCKDGTISFSRGRGTCSWHSGVNRYVDSPIYKKTMAQCREEAAKISWITP